MADSFIEVKDANSVNRKLDTDLVGDEHTPKHIVTSLPPLPVGANHIGAVEVDNAGGASAVNVQDGGNSLTVDGTVLIDEDLRTTSGTITALNGTVALNVRGKAGAAVSLTGTWVATVVPEISLDGGTTWLQVQFFNKGTVQNVGSTTGNGNFGFMLTNGATNVRVRASAFTSGTINVLMGASTIAAEQPFGTGIDGDTSAPNRAFAQGGIDSGGTFRHARTANSAPGGTEYAWITRNIPSGTQAVSDGGGSLTVDGTVTAAAQPGVDIGDVTVNNASGAGAVNIQDGGNSITVDGTVTANAGTGPFPVSDNGGSLTVDGTVAISGTVTVDEGANALEVVGDVAHDAVVAGNPVLNGMEARTTDPTAVASGDAVRMQGDTLGKQVVLLGANHDRKVRGTATYTTTTASDLVAAQGAGVRIVVTSVLVTNAHATVGTKVEIRDGTTVRIQGFAAAAGGGFSWNDPTGLFISTANTAVTGRCVTTGADVDITVAGYTISN